ncbi:hypothetical protein O1R50_22685 [Glycomyces luteolus]|uniref:Uncharacterized protein n=1 Tax=Glycomyces luteolus TaxID=2670330 RepID=A0A9X3PH18_9ACTN|nr:hypothetical protein [Glycomyces luteolus]MDA1362449.1 hypothetical protein [Glycomyces luteolus]
MTLLDAGTGYTASYDASENLYSVTNTATGQTTQMTEDSFDEFITKLGSTIEDLATFRAQLLSGSTVVTRPYTEAYPQAGYYQAEIDTLNPKFGGFDDALELQQVYRTVFYPTRAEQLDRVYHGLDTGRVVSEDIKTSYLENDGNVSADVVNIQSEFESSGGGITASDVDEVKSGDQNGTDTSTSGESGSEEPIEML